MNYDALDVQLARFADLLVGEVGVNSAEAQSLASRIAAEIRELSLEAHADVHRSTPIAVQARLDELVAFQAWMDQLASQRLTAPAVRAQVIVQNCLCFVYLGEACFRVLQRVSASGSLTKRCCRFLTDNPVRAFRNAVAHGNWHYRSDFGALVYWARKGSDPAETMSRFEVTQQQMTFWQALSRCVAYTAFSSLRDELVPN